MHGCVRECDIPVLISSTGEFSQPRVECRCIFICRSSCLPTVGEHLGLRVLALERVCDDQTDRALNGNAFEL